MLRRVHFFLLEISSEPLVTSSPNFFYLKISCKSTQGRKAHVFSVVGSGSPPQMPSMGLHAGLAQDPWCSLTSWHPTGFSRWEMGTGHRKASHHSLHGPLRPSPLRQWRVTFLSPRTPSCCWPLPQGCWQGCSSGKGPHAVPAGLGVTPDASPFLVPPLHPAHIFVNRTFKLSSWSLQNFLNCSKIYIKFTIWTFFLSVRVKRVKYVHCAAIDL